jgi:hypothetical protein
MASFWLPPEGVLASDSPAGVSGTKQVYSPGAARTPTSLFNPLN